VTRRFPAVSAALAAAAFGLAGCGGGDGPESALDDALRYLPDDVPAVGVIETDGESDQWRQATELIERFAIADQIKEEGKKRLQGQRDFDDDLKPLLGNPVVIGIPQAFVGTTRSAPTILAFRTSDEAKARELLERASRLGEAHGAEIYALPGPRFVAIEDATVVSSSDRAALQAALARHDGDDNLTEDEFEDSMGDLDRDALIRVAGDLEGALESGRKAAAARSAPWLGSVRSFAAVVFARDDGLAADFEVRTEDATAADLPLAPGAQAPPVPRRAGEIGIAMREPARAFVFLDALRQALPKGDDYARFQAALERIGIDLRRDILDHLGAEAALSFALDGTYAARADLNDAPGVADALRTIATRLPAALGSRGDSGLRIEPGGGEGFYRLTASSGKQTFVGVVGDRLALGSEAGRARDFADDESEPVPGARGSVAIYGNAEEVANKLIAGSDNPFAALFGQALTEPLGDLTGSIEAKPEGITGHLDLKIEE
jgi:hypothetical protein